VKEVSRGRFEVLSQYYRDWIDETTIQLVQLVQTPMFETEATDFEPGQEPTRSR
jgi:hypothetical protein